MIVVYYCGFYLRNETGIVWSVHVDRPINCNFFRMNDFLLVFYYSAVLYSYLHASFRRIERSSVSTLHASTQALEKQSSSALQQRHTSSVQEKKRINWASTSLGARIVDGTRELDIFESTTFLPRWLREFAAPLILSKDQVQWNIRRRVILCMCASYS